MTKSLTGQSVPPRGSHSAYERDHHLQDDVRCSPPMAGQDSFLMVTHNWPPKLTSLFRTACTAWCPKEALSWQPHQVPPALLPTPAGPHAWFQKCNCNCRFGTGDNSCSTWETERKVPCIAVLSSKQTAFGWTRQLGAPMNIDGPQSCCVSKRLIRCLITRSAMARLEDGKAASLRQTKLPAARLPRRESPDTCRKP